MSAVRLAAVASLMALAAGPAPALGQVVTATPLLTLPVPALEEYRAGRIDAQFTLSVTDADGSYEVRLARGHNVSLPLREVHVRTAESGGWVVIVAGAPFEEAPIIFPARSTDLTQATVEVRLLLDWTQESPGRYGGVLEVLVVPLS
jgi:hypothetical protein